MAPIMHRSCSPKYNDPDNFTMEIHHGGNFKKGKYLGGRGDDWDNLWENEQDLGEFVEVAIRVDGLSVADKGTSFNIAVDTLDCDADDEFEDNDEDLNGNYEM
ncbi:hypothetical protein L3X38_019143 [Prunus dulcis]|uniref:Uncharacterized protein n=1 Tax=Prunus dulcis TaxID=3755 RepID=A0AAD4WAD5_PRUDU|nr:hypothetical protein L3X38_019143 [Prunus dulcis]